MCVCLVGLSVGLVCVHARPYLVSWVPITSLINEVVNISAVIDYLEKTFGYQVDLIVGHSRASIVAFCWLCTTEARKKVSGFVNISG